MIVQRARLLRLLRWLRHAEYPSYGLGRNGRLTPTAPEERSAIGCPGYVARSSGRRRRRRLLLPRSDSEHLGEFLAVILQSRDHIRATLQLALAHPALHDERI